MQPLDADVTSDTAGSALTLAFGKRAFFSLTLSSALLLFTFTVPKLYDCGSLLFLVCFSTTLFLFTVGLAWSVSKTAYLIVSSILFCMLALALHRIDFQKLYLDVHERELVTQIAAASSSPKIYTRLIANHDNFPAGQTWDYIISDETDYLPKSEDLLEVHLVGLTQFKLEFISESCLVRSRHLRDHYYYVIVTC